MKCFLLILAATLACAAVTRDDRVLGGTSAPVRVEIFSSFDCEPCKQLHEAFLPLLVQNYVLQGKVYVVPHESPLQGHPLARKAADYATAAARIGKYWPVADALFQHQAEWEARGEVWTTVASVLTPEEQKQVQSLANDPSVDAEVERDASRKFEYIPTILITSGTPDIPGKRITSF